MFGGLVAVGAREEVASEVRVEAGEQPALAERARGDVLHDLGAEQRRALGEQLDLVKGGTLRVEEPMARAQCNGG